MYTHRLKMHTSSTYPAFPRIYFVLYSDSVQKQHDDLFHERILLMKSRDTVKKAFLAAFPCWIDIREPAGKPTPRYIQYLGKVLPAAVFGMLIIYCLKNVSIFAGSHAVPELISITVVIALHLWKRQMLLSIAGGTVCYMLLVQMVF